MENKLLEQALYYVQNKKWFVFPTRERQYSYVDENKEEKILKPKSPYISGGFQSATQDVEQVKLWWSKYPEAGIGISCGHSGLVCIDIDVKSGVNGFENFMRLNISDEGALHAFTPSGGSHIIFKGEMFSHANIRAGVDIRSKGAYFVAPPSYIYDDKNNKGFYVAMDDWSVEPAPVPSSLTEQLKLLRVQGERREHKTINESLETTIQKAQKALDSLPLEYCEDYFMWVNVGMCLFELGDTGLDMWVEWSRKTRKENQFDLSECIKRWEKFSPRELTINTLFYYAKEAEKNNG